MNQSQGFLNKEKLVIELPILGKKFVVNILGLTSLKRNIKLQENIEKDQSIIMEYG